MSAPRVVPASGEHVPEIAAIYAEAAASSYATFDVRGQSEERWHEQVAAVDPGAGRMLLVALDPGGAVLGYAKSGEHKARPAYAVTCETSAYLAPGARGRGVGGALYDELLARLDASPLRLAVAGVAEPNQASARLHLSRGFTPVGRFSGIGAKRGRAWDVTWYERPLAVHPLVAELRALVARGGTPADAAAALAKSCGTGRVEAGELEGGVPILDPRTGEPVGALAAGNGASGLLLDWCAEALAPLFTR